MNKGELIDSISEKSGLTKADSERAVSALLESVQEALSNGDPVVLVGFGTFKTSARAARVGRNPKTGEPLKIAAATRPVFSAGAKLKEAVNSGKKAKKK